MNTRIGISRLTLAYGRTHVRSVPYRPHYTSLHDMTDVTHLPVQSRTMNLDHNRGRGLIGNIDDSTHATPGGGDYALEERPS